MRATTSFARSVLVLGFAALLSLGVYAAPHRPRLVVILVVDQFRGDYVQKFSQQWTGGLHRLLTEGAYFSRAEYPYYNTVTCAGHATISTGATPSVHGMILNGWWDRSLRREVACADDDLWNVVSYGQPLTGSGESARRLRTSTLADELRAQLDPKTRVITFSLKARSAVTLAGQRADASVWFDDRGAWVSSTVYGPAPVPAVASFVRDHPIEKDYGAIWDRARPIAEYLFESPAIGVVPKSSMTAAFPHVVRGLGDEPDATFYSQWQSSPMADAYLASMALSTTRALGAGQSDRTDFLGIGFSTLDKVGHDFGPNSHEIQDVLIRLDQTLGAFLAELDRQVGAGNYVVALSADHGIAPIPERARMMGLDAGRVASITIESVIEAALAPLGPVKHVERVSNEDVYLTPGTWRQLRQSPVTLANLRTRLAQTPGVLRVYTRDELEANHFDDDEVGRSVARGYYAERSGDLALVLKPYWMLSGSGTTHGSGWGYDTRVPVVIFGSGIAPGEYRAAASPTDIAPTLAFLSGITLPRAQGRVLLEALAPATTNRH